MWKPQKRKRFNKPRKVQQKSSPFNLRRKIRSLTRRSRNLDRFYIKRETGQRFPRFKVSRNRKLRLSPYQLQWVGSVSTQLVRCNAAMLRDFFHNKINPRRKQQLLRSYVAPALSWRSARQKYRARSVTQQRWSARLYARRQARHLLRRARLLLRQGRVSRRRRVAAYTLVRQLRHTLYLRKLIGRRRRSKRLRRRVPYRRRSSKPNKKRYSSRSRGYGKGTRKKPLRGYWRRRQQRLVRKKAKKQARLTTQPHSSKFSRRAKYNKKFGERELAEIRRRGSLKRKARRTLKTHVHVLRRRALSRFRAVLHVWSRRVFRRKRRRVLRTASHRARTHLKWLQRLRQAIVWQRRDEKVIHKRRWWWRGRRQLRMRRWRTRKQSSHINTKDYWQRNNHYLLASKRPRHSYNTKLSALQATAANQRRYFALRGSRLRRVYVTTGHQMIKQVPSALHTPAAFLRTRLRRLVRSKKTSSRKRVCTPRQLPHVKRRLDTRLLELSTPRPSSQYFAAPIVTPTRHLTAALRGTKLSSARAFTHENISYQLTRRVQSSSRRLQRLKIQRQVRTSVVLSDTSASKAILSEASAPRLLLQSRGSLSTLASARLYTNQVFNEEALRTTIAPLRAAQAARVEATITQRHSSLFLTRVCGPDNTSVVTYPQHFGFLRNGPRHTLRKYTRVELLSERSVTRQRSHYMAARIIHRRPKLRLPNTALTRARSRKGGLIAFAQNPLKRPRTLAGRKNLLLPPVNFYSTVKKVRGPGHAIHSRTLTRYTRREDALPIFWIRPHNRVNKKAVTLVRRKRFRLYRQSNNRFKGRRQRSQKRVVPQQVAPLAAIVAPPGSSTALRQKTTAELRIQQASAGILSLKPRYHHPRRITAAVRQKWRKWRTSRKGRYSARLHLTAPRHILGRQAPMRSRLNSVVALSAGKTGSVATRLHSLWQVRSTNAALIAERNMLAWSPQLSVRSRRLHYPRPEGYPVPQKRLTYTARKNRRKANARRLRRGAPQRRYTDYNSARLHYFYGSVGSAGYLRFRRVHRSHSKNSRWWRPTLRPAPFAHPFSRRPLVATRYLKTLHQKTRTQKNAMGFTRTLRVKRGFILRTSSPKLIPWRSFSYRKPLHGNTPKMLQRYIYNVRGGKTSRTPAGKSAITLTRSTRQIRKLHQYVSARGVYSNRRWGVLDNITLDSASRGQFSLAVSRIPTSVWAALYRKVGSSEAYVAARSIIFNKFKTWIRRRQTVEPVFSVATTNLAQATLVQFLRSALSRHTNLLRSTRHSILRNSAFGSRVRHKAVQHLKLRELTGASLGFTPSQLLRRERSKVYKRWLSGVEGKLKRTQVNYTPTSRSRYTDNISTIYGRHRVRFPASGRRRRSYDSLLHSFAKKSSPGHFRRVSKLRFLWARPSLATDFQENLNTLTPMFGAIRRSYAARKLSAVAYLPSGMRELLLSRSITSASVFLSKSAGIGAKRRFLSLPLYKLFVLRRREHRKVSPHRRPYMHNVRAGLLRRALRHRRRERVYVDLRISALNRRLPRDKPLKLWRLRRRRSILRLGARRRGRYSRRNSQERKKLRSWTLSYLSVVGPSREQRRPHPLPPVLSYGEEVSVKEPAVRKRARAVRGFKLHPHPRRGRRKLRRQPRDATSVPRRLRRWNRSLLQRIQGKLRHWSERRLPHFKKQIYSPWRSALAKIVSRKFRGRFRNRFSASVVLSTGASPRLVNFLSHRAGSAMTTQTRDTTMPASAASLDTVSYLRDRDRVWFRRKRSRFARRRLRSYPLQEALSRYYQFSDALEIARERTKSTLPSRLVSSVATLSITSPLWFECPVTRVVKSEAKKKQEAAAAIAAKELTFRLPTQYVEGVTSLIPALMNYIVSKKIQNRNLTYEAAKCMIRNIYWSLRVHLNVDPFDGRFFVRDKVPAARVLIFEEMFELAKQQKTLQPNRAVLRYRFQPARLIRARNTQRFREDWLRAFFPSRHALFQENPEDYGKFLLATHKLRRLNIGPRGVQTWSTRRTSVGLESRSRQLIRLRYSPRKRRFETLLQTTRRNPVVEPAPSALVNVAREPFFTRHFSTYCTRGLVLTSSWVHRQKRFVTLDAGWRTLPPATLVLARRRLVPRLEARGRTRYIATDWKAAITSRLDGRFGRLKSPRSRQYVIRLPKKLANLPKPKLLTGVYNYRLLSEKHALAKNKKPDVLPRARVRRRAWSFAFKRALSADVLSTARRLNAFRRIQATVFSQKKQASIQKSFKTSRSVLHYRTPTERTSAVTYKAATALLFSNVAPAPVFKKLRLLAKSIRKVRHGQWRLTSSRQLQRLKRLEYKVKRALRQKWQTFPKKMLVSSWRGRARVLSRSIQAGRCRRNRGYFDSVGGLHVAGSIDLSAGVAALVHRRQEAPFEAHRPQLWNSLTLRWTKRYRIGRYWIRDTSQWLRDPWLSGAVSTDGKLLRDRFTGALKKRPQGTAAKHLAAVASRAPKQHVAPGRVNSKAKQPRTTSQPISVVRKIVARQRQHLAKLAKRYPAPSMQQANSDYRDVVREHKEERAKSTQQKAEEEALRINEYWAHKAKKLPPIRQKRLPLKRPSNLWLPHVIWKDIQRRVRKFAWRESDQVFERRGFRNGFRFKPNERRKAGWLEYLIYTRATYSTRLREFRRRQFPHEQKKYKWLQRVRKQLYSAQRRYIKRRRWRQLGNYNNKLHYSLFSIRDRSAARRHFRKLNGKSRPNNSAFVTLGQGLTNRLDVTCILMGLAPTIYWARIVSAFGLLRVNGRTVYRPSYQLKASDIVHINHDIVTRFQHYFQSYAGWWQWRSQHKQATTGYPKNMVYNRITGALVYKHAPDESDLRKYGRIRALYLRWFKLDSA